MHAEIDDGRKTWHPEQNALAWAKSATNFAIPDSEDEDNFAQLKNGNHRLSSTVGNRGSSSRKIKVLVTLWMIPDARQRRKERLESQRGGSGQQATAATVPYWGTTTMGATTTLISTRMLGAVTSKWPTATRRELEKASNYQEDEGDDMFGGFDAGETKRWHLLTKMRGPRKRQKEAKSKQRST